jgi:hypothetical protein
MNTWLSIATLRRERKKKPLANMSMVPTISNFERQNEN